MTDVDSTARRGTPWRISVLYFSVVLLCLLSYYDVPSYYFVGGDTFPIIESARVRAPSDVYRILTEPLMSGTSFLELGVFYRPVSVLSFSLDHALWGLDHRGYNTTGLLIHVVNALLLLLLLRRLTGGDDLAAWAVAALFAIHPVTAEVVRSTDYRQDSLATALFLASTLLFLRWLGGRTIAWLIASLLFFFLSLGSKESTAVLVGLIAVIALVRSTGLLRSRLWSAFKEALPYLLVVVVWIIWRSHVVGGLGGYLESADGIMKRLLIMVAIVVAYFIDFVSPMTVDIMESSLRSMGVGEGLAIIVGFSIVLGFAGLLWWKLSQEMKESFSSTPSTPSTPSMREAFTITTAGALLALPLLASLLLFAHRLMYLPVLFFCGAFGIALVASLRKLIALISSLKEGGGRQVGRLLSTVPWLTISSLFILTTLVIISGSPLFSKRNKLQLAGEVARSFIGDVEVALENQERARGNEHPHQLNLCVHNTTRRGRNPSLTSENPGSLPRYITRALESWLHLKYPNRRLVIFLQDGGEPQSRWGAPKSTFPLTQGGVIVVYVPPPATTCDG